MTATRPLLLAVLSASLGCATVNVQTEYDIKTDFSKFRTYDFITSVPGQEQAPSIRNPVVRGWVETAVQRELAARGCSRVSGGARPDFLVAYHAWGKTKVEVSQYGYGYVPGPYYYGYGMYPYAAGGVVTDVREYKEGTFVLDFVDNESKLLAWRGTASGTLSGSEPTPADVNDIVSSVLKGYPPEKKK
ncbi:MAG TPA: DUF4136 domain-containing protein [Anaeromyxobacteraceae bacterium]|nr:DUF4136 domain-containing protein [Anaeromyxobacteraceae bacterium]